MSEEEENGQGQSGDMPSQEIYWKKKAEENLNGWKRALADYQNLKKQNERGAHALAAMMAKVALLGLLPFIDNFEKALGHIPQEFRTSDWHRGLIQTKSLLDGYLEHLGIKEIPVIGKPCDPSTSETAGSEVSEEHPEHIVLREVEKGYMIGDELLRPAKVIVSKKPPVSHAA